jgi:hypothetical protein
MDGVANDMNGGGCAEHDVRALAPGNKNKRNAASSKSSSPRNGSRHDASRVSRSLRAEALAMPVKSYVGPQTLELSERRAWMPPNRQTSRNSVTGRSEGSASQPIARTVRPAWRRRHPIVLTVELHSRRPHRRLCSRQQARPRIGEMSDRKPGTQTLSFRSTQPGNRPDGPAHERGDSASFRPPETIPPPRPSFAQFC